MGFRRARRTLATTGDFPGGRQDDHAGALAALAALRDDPARRFALGAEAAASARMMFDPDTLAVAYRRLVAAA